MSPRRPLLFTALGVLFLLAGLVTMLGIISAWSLGAPVRGEFFGYTAMNFLLAYGFFAMQRWLLPALALNWLAGAGLVAVKAFVHTPSPGAAALYAASFCLGGLIFLTVYLLPKKKFLPSQHERLAGGAFFIIWAATACYTVVGLFT